MRTKSVKEEHTFDTYIDDWIDYIKSPRYVYYQKYVLQLIKKFNRSRNKVLELGCGITPFLRHMNKSENFGLDISQAMLDRNDTRIATFIKGDALKCSSIIKHKFNLIFMTGLLHHLDEKDHYKLIKQIRLLLRNNGYFIMVEPNMISVTGIYYLIRKFITKFVGIKMTRTLIGIFGEDEKYIFPNKAIKMLNSQQFKVKSASSFMLLRLPPLKVFRNINIEKINKIVDKVLVNQPLFGTTLVIVSQKT